MVGGMSAQFPNVPDLPGVPPVARASAVLQSMLGQTGLSLSTAREALAAINAADYGSATGLLTTSNGNASSALAQAQAIFSAGSDITASLSGSADNSAAALVALAASNITSATVLTGQTVSASSIAYAAISQIINPTPENVLAGSSAAVNAAAASQWGLFTQDGELAAPADNVVAFESALEARISDYPVAPNTTGAPNETVGFGSYNKVIVPYDIRLMMSRGGSVEDRIAFYGAITAAWQSTELFNVVTPECVYLDVNVIGVRRMAAGDRGAGLMTLEIALRKVRQTATLSFTQTKEPSGSGQVKDGSVQTTQPADAQQYAGAGQ